MMSNLSKILETNSDSNLDMSESSRQSFTFYLQNEQLGEN